MTEDKKKRKGCGWGCLTAAVVVIGLVLVVAAGLAVWAVKDHGGSDLSWLFGSGTKGAGGGEDESPHMREIWSSGNGTTRVVRIPLTGMIMFQEGGWDSDASGATETTLRSIRRATSDPQVQGILLEVDSGGGGITASDILYDALLAFRDAQEGRVIVAHMGDVAASGGYYVALAADYIMAHPTTLTGSIGVLMQSYNVRDLAGKIGLRDVTIKSGENKDLLNPFSELSEEQRRMLQQVVDALHARFIGLVAESRELPEAQVRELADGRVFLAADALASGLIDGIGYADDAAETASELLGGAELEIYRYSEEPSIFDLLRGGPSFFGASNLRGLLDGGGSRLMYRWPF